MAKDIQTECCTLRDTFIEKQFGRLNEMQRQAVFTTSGPLLGQGNANGTTAPHTMLWPSLFLGLLMISFNLFGNGLRDAFNPSTRGVED